MPPAFLSLCDECWHTEYESEIVERDLTIQVFLFSQSPSQRALLALLVGAACTGAYYVQQLNFNKTTSTKNAVVCNVGGRVV